MFKYFILRYDDVVCFNEFNLIYKLLKSDDFCFGNFNQVILNVGEAFYFFLEVAVYYASCSFPFHYIL